MRKLKEKSMGEFISKAYLEKTSSIGIIVRLTGKSIASVKSLVKAGVITPKFDVAIGRSYYSAEDADKACLAFFCKDKLGIGYNGVKYLLALFKIYFPEYSIGEVCAMLEKAHKAVESNRIK